MKLQILSITVVSAGLVACSTTADSVGSTSASDTITDGDDSGLYGAGEGGQDGALDVAPDGGDASSFPVGYGPYGSPGPYAVTTASLEVAPPTASAFAVTAYIPSSFGPHPVVILSSGFFQSALGYAPYGENLASWGIVTITRNDPGLDEETTTVVNDVVYEVTTWLAATNLDPASALFGQVDATNIGLAGHSRGGQVSLLAAEGGAAGLINGLFGLDPVNGSPSAAPGLAAVGLPVAFIGETTDSAWDGCAPAKDNYESLYSSAASPIVALTAIGADHTMFEDPNHCFACIVCKAGSADPPTVLSYSVRYLTAYFARQLLGDSSVGPNFEGAGAPIDEELGLISVQSK